MSNINESIYTDFADWFGERPKWMQNAASRLLEGTIITPEVVKEFARMAIDEALGELAEPETSLNIAALGAVDGTSIKLRGISDVTGIGHLCPRNPLKFGTSPITVVYGTNGTGKSSYVRILKHSCGARNKGKLHPNIFTSASDPQSCVIAYSEEDSEKSIQWNPDSGVAAELATVDIFDTHCGDSYLAKEGEPSYEPRILAFLSDLAQFCDEVSARLDRELQKRAKALPLLPHELATSDSGKWYSDLSANTTQENIDSKCVWLEAYDKEWSDLEKYLSERSPKDRANELLKRKDFADDVSGSLKQLAAEYSDESCQTVVNLRKLAKESQEAAELAAKLHLKEAALTGVGSAPWLSLWNIARAYSTEVAYPNEEFPYVGDGSRCVLCQQELEIEGKHRLQAFEAYVAAEAAKTAKRTKKELEVALAELPEVPHDTLNTKVASAGLMEGDTEDLKKILAIMDSRRQLLLSDTVPTDFGNEANLSDLLSKLDAVSTAHGAKAKEFLENFNEEERSRKLVRKNELSALKWVSEQKAAVEAEVKRLKQVGILNNAKKLCATNALSRKKGALSEELLTPAYIKSFNDELRNLGARTVKVELTKTGVSRGHVLHQVKLKDATLSRPIHEILSEGEHRIVCIAAFLADVSSKPNSSTFVFDDPISSLDLDFEEAVVQRLVALSKERQVLIFTHRLSLLGMVQDYAKKDSIVTNVIHIRREHWGAGEPGDESIECAKPKACLNQHLPTRIREARRISEENGEAAYRIHAQQICSEIRKLIERMIESELLADVVQRHRRAINTQGKIDKLPDITVEDCKVVEDMMTKYSRYEHSQSNEAPVPLPHPDEMEEDIADLKTWRDAIEQRRR
jgi:ABC-type Mn2+/Zn2+ transport system ATPase subunit